jgi:hypothetical protein
MKRAFFLLLLVIALVACGETQPAPVNQSATATAQAAASVSAGETAITSDLTVTAAMTPSPTIYPTHSPITFTWKTTHTFTGNGTKSTEIFAVADDWKILYTCTYQLNGQVDGVLGVEVYNADNTIRDVAVNTRCHDRVTTGETELHQGGQLFLKMISTGDWTVLVQELQ